MRGLGRLLGRARSGLGGLPGQPVPQNINGI
jgi:hypothetical protein